MLNKCLSGKRGYWLGFFASFGLVALALWIQTRYQLNPCPLCISQRMVFMGLGLLFLVGALLPAKAIWLQAHRDSIIADCGVGFDYMFENFPLQKALTLVFRGTGDCAAIDWTFLGLSLPQLALLAYLGLAAYALYLTKK
jgi:disulfide bond formation protein DsbB